MKRQNALPSLTRTEPDKVTAYEDGQVESAVGHRVVQHVGWTQSLLQPYLPLLPEKHKHTQQLVSVCTGISVWTMIYTQALF